MSAVLTIGGEPLPGGPGDRWPAYRPYDDGEINAIAFGSLDGSVFGSWMIDVADRGRIMPSVLFRPLGLMTGPQIQMMAVMGVVAFWDFTSAAVARFEKYPVFQTMRLMSLADLERLSAAVGPAQAFNKAVATAPAVGRA